MQQNNNIQQSTTNTRKWIQIVFFFVKTQSIQLLIIISIKGVE